MTDIKFEPDLPPRYAGFHRKIVAVEPIPDTKSGNLICLDCGHVVQVYGNLEYAEGRILCTLCRDKGANATT